MSAICDFCSRPDVRWAFPARDFSRAVAATPLSLNSTGGWAACQECHDMILACDRDALLKRSVDNFSGSGLLPREVIEKAIRDIHDSFWSQREGAPVPTTPDQEDPTR